MKKITLLISLFYSSLWAQSLLDELKTNEKEYVRATFKQSRVINSHSTEVTYKKHLDVRITHKFGDVAMGEKGVFGLYSLDDMRIGFEYGLIDRLMVGLGRTKIKGFYDGFVKYQLLKQTTNNKMPVSLTILANTAYQSQLPSFITKSITNRMSYTVQALLARKFGERLSIQFMPTYFHRNQVVNFNEKNDIFAIGAAIRFKVTDRFVLTSDYFFNLDEYTRNAFYAPVGLGAELETGGHVFAMFFTNSKGIIENEFLANTTSNLQKGGFRFGFTISRIFSFDNSGRKKKSATK